MLGTNHRSTASVVAAVKITYEFATRKRATARRLHVQRRYGPATRCPSHRSKRRVGRRPSSVWPAPSPLSPLALDPSLLNAETSRRHFAARCAERIVSRAERSGSRLRGGGQPSCDCARPTSAVLVPTARPPPPCSANCAAGGSPRSTYSARTRSSPAPRRRTCCTGCVRWPEPLDVRLARAALADAHCRPVDRRTACARAR